MKVSVLQPYSYGYVVSIREGSHYVEVCPIERLGFLNGEINGQVSTAQQQGVDGNQQKYTITMEFSNSLPARWLPEETQRVTPPDVRVGEQVMIYRFADSTQYFWRTLGLTNHLRRLETVIYAFSATAEEVEELTPDNSYFFEVSSHAKHISLSTSKANGEPFAYLVQINTDDGIITITDDDSTFIFLNSKERNIRLENKDGSFLSIDKRDIFVNAPDTYKLTCKDMIVEASNSITETTTTKSTTASNSITETTQQYSITASNSMSIKTNKYSLTASLAAMTATFMMKGSSTFTGRMNVNSALNVDAMITGQSGNFVGALFSMGKNVGGVHTHSNSGAGIPN